MKRITIIGGGASGTLLATPDGTLIGRDGNPSEVLYTLGTALKGILW